MFDAQETRPNKSPLSWVPRARGAGAQPAGACLSCAHHRGHRLGARWHSLAPSLLWEAPSASVPGGSGAGRKGTRASHRSRSVSAENPRERREHLSPDPAGETRPTDSGCRGSSGTTRPRLSRGEAPSKGPVWEAVGGPRGAHGAQKLAQTPIDRCLKVPEGQRLYFNQYTFGGGGRLPRCGGPRLLP